MTETELVSSGEVEDGPVARQDEEAHEGGSADGPALTIDELASETGVPSRTIRFYQAKGAIPPPMKRGRVAFYGAAHVDRLKLVAELQDRGLHLKAIRDLVNRADAGDVSVADWLGVGEKLRAPWSDDRPRMMTERELHDLIGHRRGIVADLVGAGLVRPEGDAVPPCYVVKSPGLLQVAVRLADAGVDVATAKEVTDILRKQLSRAATGLVAELAKDAKRGGRPSELVTSLDALRSVGVEAVRLVFAQEMERAIRVAVERGQILPAPARPVQRAKERAERQATRLRDRAQRSADRARKRAARAGRKRKDPT